MTGRFTGKTAVITGSGRRDGLGAAIAHRLAAEGAAVVLSDLATSGTAAREIEGIADSIRAGGGCASICACDVTAWPDVRALADHARDVHGSLDFWINNAGIGFIMKPLLDLAPDDWSRVIDVNLTGAFYGLRVAAAVMVAQKRGGRIINIASQAAKSGFPHAQAYCASKHGLVGLIRSAAIDLGPHAITVNNVCPNHVTTQLGTWQNEYFSARAGVSVERYLAEMAARVPLGRAGVATDTASAVAFLCSDDAGYITAESLNVSGGEEPH